jgi:hypothetical protein
VLGSLGSKIIETRLLADKALLELLDISFNLSRLKKRKILECTDG